MIRKKKKMAFVMSDIGASWLYPAIAKKKRKKCGQGEIRTHDFCMKDGHSTNLATMNITAKLSKKLLTMPYGIMCVVNVMQAATRDQKTPGLHGSLLDANSIPGSV